MSKFGIEDELDTKNNVTYRWTTTRGSNKRGLEMRTIRRVKKLSFRFSFELVFSPQRDILIIKSRRIDFRIGCKSSNYQDSTGTRCYYFSIHRE